MSDSRPAPKSRMARRAVLIGALALGGVTAANWFNIGGRLTAGDLSVQAAHIGAKNGDFTLIDIRRPDEWAQTGLPEGAVPLDMRDREFVQKLTAQVSTMNAPIALICARGVRSRNLASALKEAGFTNVIDVPEGMLGSGAGPGWLAANLPVTKF